ncbi:diguanylate cyclase (GGDEF) domain-containing protein [Rheinheimera sp. A13L]|uniref:GGDEF domain-containing protein n=1 Tax=Rheinheimera sp. A13L TaxID=506534 RepID=UPI0002124B80|nr:GGDEF domain-containing protein [Rheinheimera sp. A13L]EGM79013.1 diguanylate cyclase (GGDEF) domain-containing protein [Rheinheimera sp. A13L]
MSAKPQVPVKKVTVKRATLHGVLKKNEEIKIDVGRAAGELASVNDVLKQRNASIQTMRIALTQNADAEIRVAKAAEDLKRVNVKLANEIAVRIGIESELDSMKADLATVRDDLLQSQVTERQAQQLALTDALTGLANRASYELALNQGLAQAKRQGWGLAVMFIDVDKFKHINDSHGHEMGDKVLLMVANRLQSFVREGDMVSRWGGDEFVCLLLEVKDKNDVLTLAKKLAVRVAEAVTFNCMTLHVKISIGIALFPADGDTAQLLIKHADTAMYQAKGSDRQVVLFRHHSDTEPD